MSRRLLFALFLALLPSAAWAINVPTGVVPPQGRITDSSTSCSHTTDSTTVTTLYYLACTGDTLPISVNGTTFDYFAIPGSGTTLSTANSTNFPANTIFDFYAFISSGAVTYCAVKWGTSTAGSSARGSSATITTLLGITVNNGAWTCLNGATSYTLTTKEATLLGSFVISGTAQDIAMNFAPAAASGGPASVPTVGYANIYNTQSATLISRDSKGAAPSTGAWTYESTTIEELDASSTNQINWVDPLGAYPYSATLVVPGKTATVGDNCQAGIGINSTTAFSGVVASFTQTLASTTAAPTAVASGLAPQSGGGLNYVAALQQAYSSSVTCSYWGSFTTNTPQVEGLVLNTLY